MQKKKAEDAKAQGESDSKPVETDAGVKDETKTKTKTKAKNPNPRLRKLREFAATKNGKIILIASGVILLAVLLLAVPIIRDATLGQLVRKQIQVKVVDDRSGGAVSGVTVLAGGIEAETNAEGIAILDGVAAAAQTLEISKPYYEAVSQEYRVPFFTTPEQQQVSLHATGEAFTFTLTDAITTSALVGATITLGDAKATTDDAGQAIVVLPYADDAQKVTFAKDGYNTKEARFTTDDTKTADAAKLTLTPAGKVMYLSKATGVIDVMQSNLDGSGSTILVKGTGNESGASTELSPSRDWKYSALRVVSLNDDDDENLYLVDGTTKQKTLIDKGDLYVTPIGWVGHKFFYTIYRKDREFWQGKQEALKAYDADTKKLHVIDETTSDYNESLGTYVSERYEAGYVLNDEVAVVKQWQYGTKYGYSYYGDVKKNAAVLSVNPSSLVKKSLTIAQVDKTTWLLLKMASPQGIYIAVVSNYEPEKATIYQYSGGGVTAQKDMTYTQLSAMPAISYLLSQSGEKSFWYEERNGKNTLFIGDKNAGNAQKIADLSAYKPYGWFGDKDQYVLVTKDDNTIYVADPSLLGDDKYQPLKISSIHKPNNYYY